MSTNFFYHAFGLSGYDYGRQEFVGGSVLLHVRPKSKLIRSPLPKPRCPPSWRVKAMAA